MNRILERILHLAAKIANGENDFNLSRDFGVHIIQYTCFDPGHNDSVSRYKSLTDDPNADLLWVSEFEQMPDVCASCGLFTADRVKVKTIVTTDKKTSGAMGLVHVLLFLFGGPLGWIFALASGDTDKESKSAVKVKIKMPQCILCRQQTKLEVVESRYDKRRYRFFVNPTFASRYRLINSESN